MVSSVNMIRNLRVLCERRGDTIPSFSRRPLARGTCVQTSYPIVTVVRHPTDAYRACM